MKAIDANAVKTKVCELMIACVFDNYDESTKAKADLFLWIEKICTDLDGALREIAYLSGQLESANLDLKKAYEEKAALEEQLHPWVDDDSRLDPADYKDLPFPDVEEEAKE